MLGVNEKISARIAKLNARIDSYGSGATTSDTIKVVKKRARRVISDEEDYSLDDGSAGKKRKCESSGSAGGENSFDSGVVEKRKIGEDVKASLVTFQLILLR